MKFFRYRRPSLNTILGITKAKKRLKKELGITALMKPFRWWPNQKRRIKRKLGYESDMGRLLRNGPPTPGGCLVAIACWLGGLGLLVAAGDRPQQLGRNVYRANGNDRRSPGNRPSDDAVAPPTQRKPPVAGAACNDTLCPPL